MTVQSQMFGAASAAYTMAQLAQAADALLRAAGWTANWANAAAIGTGSLASPKFDGSPAVNSSAGVIVYTMPANGLAHQWVIELDWRWVGGTTVYALRIRTATAVDGSGNLTNPSAIAKGGQVAQSGQEAWLIASEHGFTGVWNYQAFVGVERLRTPAMAVTDDVVVYAYAMSAGVNQNWTTTTSQAGLCQTRTWGSAEYAENYMLARGGIGGSDISTAVNHPSLIRPDGSTSVVGPEIGSAGAWGNTRHVALLRYNDLTAGMDIPLTVDGANRRYTSVTMNASGPMNTRVCVARE